MVPKLSNPRAIVTLRPSESDWKLPLEMPLIKLASLMISKIQEHKSRKAIFSHQSRFFKLERPHPNNRSRFGEATEVGGLVLDAARKLKFD
jgi:hypothetical protein